MRRKTALWKYYKHKKLFNIDKKKYTYLDVWESLLNKSNNFNLECSIKFIKGKIFPCRFNIEYHNKNIIKDINLVFEFLKNIHDFGADIKYGLLKLVFNQNKHFKKVERVLAGIDLRKKYADSRAKVWFFIKKDANLFNKVLNLHKYNKKVSELVYKNELLFGFDFYFDGRSRLKIYLNFNKFELRNEIIQNKLRNIFSPEIFQLLSRCYRFEISFDKNLDRILFFFSRKRNLSNILELINHNRLNKTMNSIKNINELNKFYIGVKEKEINDKNIRSINFYY